MEIAAIPNPELKLQRAVLNDGTHVLIRWIQPDDKALLKEGLARLSARSRYQRFAMAVKELSAAELKYLTEIDNENHVAWVAIELSEGKERAVGVARYIRLDNDPDNAEVAVAVTDSHQHRGLGTLLLARLAQAAKLNGVQRFWAFVYWDNAPVLKLVRELGVRIRFVGSGMYRVTGAVPDIPVDIPQSSW